MHHAFNLIHDGFELGSRDRPLLASLQQPLQNFLPLEAFAPAVFLDHHVGNFIDALVRREPPPALDALAPPANSIAAPAFAGIDHFIVDMRAERTLHSGFSPGRVAIPEPAATSFSRTSFSFLAISFNYPSEHPSPIKLSTPA